MPTTQYLEAYLQLINDTWTYSTRKSQPMGKVFGDSVPSGAVAFTSFTPGQQTTTSKGTKQPIKTVWFNNWTNDDAAHARDTHGDTAMIVLYPGSDTPNDLITMAQYNAIKSQTSQASSQPSAQ